MIRILLLVFGFALPMTAFSQAPALGDYRSHQSGNWNDVNTWESFDGVSTWVYPSPSTPSSAMGTIVTIRAHTITVTASVAIDETTVQSGGTIVINPGVTLSLDEDFTNPNPPLTISSGTSLTNSGVFDFSLLITSSCFVNGQLTNSGSISSSVSAALVFP